MEAAIRVLVVEDELIVGLDLAASLEDEGFEVLGPFVRPEQALAAIDAARPDIGVLDVNLGDGRTSEPVAARLLELDAPFLFLTGYAASHSPALSGFPEAPVLNKPCNIARIVATIRTLL